MFHYRPAISNNQLRTFLAAIVAIALHIGLIGLNADQKPTFVPHISLPHSVNVFLGQNNTLTSEITAAKELQQDSLEEKLPVIDEVETRNSAVQKVPLAGEKPVKETQAVLSRKITAKSVKELPVEKTQVIQEEPEAVIQQNQKILRPEAESSAKNQPVLSKSGQAGSLVGEGVDLPGAIQLAHPRYQLNSPPAYPGLARKRGQQGTVILLVLVNSEGRVEDLEINVSSNFSMLDRAAMKAVKKWLFEPGRRDDEKIVMWVKVPVTFKLKNN